MIKSTIAMVFLAAPLVGCQPTDDAPVPMDELTVEQRSWVRQCAMYTHPDTCMSRVRRIRFD